MKVYIITVQYRKGGGRVVAVYTDEDKAKEEFSKFPDDDCDNYYELQEWDTK